MSLITVTYRYHGVDVAPDAANIDYVQFDSGFPSGGFSPYTTEVDVTWAGVPTHYYPAYVGPSPTVVYASAYRVSVSNTGGPVDGSSLVLHAAMGDIVLDPDDPTQAILLSIPPPDTFGGFSPDLVMTSGYVNSSSVTLGPLTPVLDVGNRGIPIDATQRWALQRASVRPAPGETN